MLKALIEKRNTAIEAMYDLVATAETEKRAFTEEEERSYEDYKKEIASLDKTIAAAEEARNLTEKKIENDDNEETDEVKEERAFKEYIVAAVEQRTTDVGLTKGNSGSIIPTSIVKRIISKTTELCPIFGKSTYFVSKGNLNIPVYNEKDGNGIKVAYQKEFAQLVSNIGKFSEISLEDELASALALVSESLIHNSDIDVVGFVVSEMAKDISIFIEKELLVGSGEEGKCEGAIKTTNTMTAAKATAITADELIDLQSKVKTFYQKNACWTMHPSTFAHIRKLKDGNQQYLYHTGGGIADGASYTLLGKPVYLSENMPKMEAGKAAILYGDYEGVGVKFGREVQLKILTEVFATKDAIGIIGKFEIGSKVLDPQMLATIKMAASAT